MRKMAALCFAAVLLTSCIGIDSRLSIREDGSGTLALTYRVSQLVADVGLSETGTSAVPLPLTRGDFDHSLEASGGKVRITKFDRSEDERDITIKVELAFDSFDALAHLDAFRDANLSLTRSGGHGTFSQLIAKPPAESLNQESQQMLDALFSDYSLSFVVEAPQPIQSSTLGTLSADKKTLTYRATVKDVVTTGSDLLLTASW
jgi:hypothetical protein